MTPPPKKDSGEPSLPRPLRNGYEGLCVIAASLKNSYFMIIKTFYPCVLPQEWIRFDSARNSRTYARGLSRSQSRIPGQRCLSPTVIEFRSPWSAFQLEHSLSYRFVCKHGVVLKWLRAPIHRSPHAHAYAWT